ncbi:hypothetical protein BKA66DRAFT_456598 [Pyrenochaeta sp. MPI-SDFR-AT-0127]|nr:hypothetical protein BKA66DRAFT_456598 [Pyrenochaeta sp. MPI-SDFR-AT-0127]
MRKFFRSCGRLPHLETLVWRFSSREDVDMKFLSDNCHIRKLMVHGPVNSRVLGNQLLPTLSRSFRYLTSLSLFWDDFTVSQQSLNLISTLTSLEQLRLGALTSSGWDCEWVIDHYAIQTALRPLIRLRKLALNRDTYEVYHDLGYGDVDPVHYYEMQRPRSYQVLLRVAYEETDADRLLFDEFLKEKWEEQHRQDMLCIASQYGDIFPELEWIFLGQLPMEIEVGKSGKKNVVLLSYDRNHCDALQQQMFGRAQELSS